MTLDVLFFILQDATIIGQGMNLDELRRDFDQFTQGNVILNVTGNAEILRSIILEMPFLKWIHSITAGVDHIICQGTSLTKPRNL